MGIIMIDDQIIQPMEGINMKSSLWALLHILIHPLASNLSLDARRFQDGVVVPITVSALVIWSQ